MSHALSALSRTSLTAAVCLQDVSKRYGAFQALAPLSLTIEPGEMIALLGPSGSGKTTLLLLISGQLEASAGRIVLQGKDLASMHPGKELARLVGMVHQQFDLVPNLSALHNVLAGRLSDWDVFTSLVSLLWPHDRVLGMTALARVGVEDRASLRAGQLSGGEKQRVAIARLLVQDPAVVLADEPVASLDPARAEEIIRLLVEVVQQANKTLVASMHSLDLARKYCSRLIGLRNGVVQFDLPSSAVTAEALESLYSLEGLGDER